LAEYQEELPEGMALLVPLLLPVEKLLLLEPPQDTPPYDPLLPDDAWALAAAPQLSPQAMAMLLPFLLRKAANSGKDLEIDSISHPLLR